MLASGLDACVVLARRASCGWRASSPSSAVCCRRLDPLQITRTSTQRLVPGVSFVLHACLLDEPAAAGVVVGGTYAVREERVEMLAGAGAVDLVEV
jgi:hypothetical protein